MGATNYTVVIKGDEKAVRLAWDKIVEEDAYESGQDLYAGNATTMRGPVRFFDHKFPTQEAADEYVLKKHQKGDGAVAASFMVEGKATDREQARKAKALEHYEGVEAKQFACLQGIVKGFVERSSTFVGCKGCQSKLSHAKLKEKIRLGNEYDRKGMNFHQGGIQRNRTFERPTLPKCPLCDTSLLSETDQKRIAGHAEKVAAEWTELMAILNTPNKPTGEVAWVVGGWAMT